MGILSLNLGYYGFHIGLELLLFKYQILHLTLIIIYLL